jgi:hypothetical protein
MGAASRHEPESGPRSAGMIRGSQTVPQGRRTSTYIEDNDFHVEGNCCAPGRGAARGHRCGLCPSELRSATRTNPSARTVDFLAPPGWTATRQSADRVRVKHAATLLDHARCGRAAH